MYKVAGEGADGGRGENRRLTIGEFPLIGVKEAREKALGAKELADRGVDPIEAKKLDFSKLTGRRFDYLLEQFLTLHVRQHTKKWRDTEQLLVSQVLPV